MQKKLIALAVAGLMSGAAFAQSNVTIYGVMDVNVNSLNTGYGSKLTVGGGGLSSNRLGFRGEEGLGGGMKAVWAMEAGINPDNGNAGAAAGTAGINQATASSSTSTGTANTFFGRQMYAGLAGNFGELTFGRQYTASYLGGAGIVDAAGGGLYNNAALILGGGMPTRMNNSIVYKTPVMSGFKAHFTYSTGVEHNVSGDVTAAGAACVVGVSCTTNDKAGRGWDLGLIYGNGPVNAVLSTWNVNNTTYAVTETALAKNTGWMLGGNYDFKAAKIHAGYVASKKRGGEYENVTVTANQTAGYYLAGVIPVGGAGKVHVTYLNWNDKSTQDRDFNAWSLSYLHDLSKRTTAYVSYGKLNNNSNSAASMVTGSDVLGTTIGTAGTATAGYDPTGVMAGVKHSF